MDKLYWFLFNLDNLKGFHDKMICWDHNLYFTHFQWGDIFKFLYMKIISYHILINLKRNNKYLYSVVEFQYICLYTSEVVKYALLRSDSSIVFLFFHKKTRNFVYHVSSYTTCEQINWRDIIQKFIIERFTIFIIRTPVIS